ncbi:hypothetical protein V5799_008348 [Amblyomma americanum]|uniref:Uncharacterized protein n=1 Tax=Amblyomma americanum TaxID=6943 RepID=A0AAQ4FDI3_AMBAM
MCSSGCWRSFKGARVKSHQLDEVGDTISSTTSLGTRLLQRHFPAWRTHSSQPRGHPYIFEAVALLFVNFLLPTQPSRNVLYNDSLSLLCKYSRF